MDWTIRPPRSARTLGLTLSAVAAVVIGTATAVGFVIADLASLSPLGVLVAAVGFVTAVAAIHIQWKRKCVIVTEDFVEYRYGAFIRHHDVVPRNRIQAVSSSVGPIQRGVGLGNAEVHPAGIGSLQLSITNFAVDDIESLVELLGRTQHRAPVEP